MAFTTENEHLITLLWESKRSVEKQYCWCLIDRRWRLDRLNIHRMQTCHHSDQCEIFNLADLRNWMGSMWSTTIQTVSTVSTFLFKVFNLKLFPVSRTMLRKWFASYFLFIYRHLLKYWSWMTNSVAVMTLSLLYTLYTIKQSTVGPAHRQKADKFTLPDLQRDDRLVHEI